MECYNVELYHHGIKGQRWGIRRYQNPDGSLTPEGRERYGLNFYYPIPKNDKIVIKSGESVQRISSKEKEINKGPTYVTFTELDNLRYQTFAGLNEGLNWTADYSDEKNPSLGKKLKIKVTHDIVIPSFNEAMQSFVKSVSKDDLDKLASKRKSLKNDAQKRLRKALNYLDIRDVQEYAIKEWSSSFEKFPELTKKFFSDLEKKGYNAILDYEDYDSISEKPVLIFKRENVLSNTPHIVKNIDEYYRDSALALLEKKVDALRAKGIKAWVV